MVNEELTPHLFLVTNGGLEHNITFHSLKIPLMVIFKELNLESLVAIRTIMSILNIGFQNVVKWKKLVAIR